MDSDEGDNEFTPFRNIMNEWYAKDISKKRKIVNKLKGNAGVPLSPPPYGYEDNVSGKINDDRFSKMSKRYEQEQGENAKKIKALREELRKKDTQQMDMDIFLEAVRRYTGATKLARRMVAELTEHIDVYHAEKQDGITTQKIVIHYNCIGPFVVPDRKDIPELDILMETRKEVAVSYSPAEISS